jgi:hypothetical protein
VTILGRGDLSPPRHHRSRTGLLIGVLAVALLGAGGYFGWRELHGSGSSKATLIPICTTPSPSPSPVAASAVTIVLRNGTPQVGLAHRLADLLEGRGFKVASVGNTRTPVTGVAVVLYPPGQEGAALAVAEQFPGVTLTPDPTGASGRVQLEIGSGYRSLATAAQVAAAHARDQAAASPPPPVCTTPNH